MIFSVLTPLYLLDLWRRFSEAFYQYIRLEAIQGLLEMRKMTKLFNE
jgi:hypothetical protein